MQGIYPKPAHFTPTWCGYGRIPWTQTRGRDSGTPTQACRPWRVCVCVCSEGHAAVAVPAAEVVSRQLRSVSSSTTTNSLTEQRTGHCLVDTSVSCLSSSTSTLVMMMMMMMVTEVIPWLALASLQTTRSVLLLLLLLLVLQVLVGLYWLHVSTL